MSGGTLSAATSSTGGGRAFRPGPRTALGLAVALLAVLALLVVVVGFGGGQKAADGPVTSYGHLPKWLPRLNTAAPKLEVATATRPMLSEAQGYTVQAMLPGGATDITAVGPQIPNWVASYVQSGVWPAAKPVPGTFMVTLAAVRGSVPISLSAFTVLTNAGKIVHPKVTVVGGGAVPAVVHSGEHLNLKLTAPVLEGAGSIRWSPSGRRVLVAWIYELELD